MEAYLIQGSDIWKEYRKTKVTASDAAKIMGCSPWGTPYKLWLEKTGRKEDEPNNYAMDYGIQKEDMIRSWFEMKEGSWFPPECVQSKAHPFMSASLDGISADRKTILEIKTCGEKTFKDARDGIIPEHYVYQGLHQLVCVTEAEKVRFVFYSNGEYAEFDLFRDDNKIAEMVEAERIFYEEHLLTDIPPELSEKDHLNMEDSKEWAFLSSQAKVFYEEYQREKKRFKEFEDRWNLFKQNFLELSDDGNCEGHGIKLTRSWRKGGLDTAKMQADGIDVDKYYKSSFCVTTLKVTKEKK